MIDQIDRKQVDPEMMIRAEALIAGFRYARGESKINFVKPETAVRAKRNLTPMSEIEQKIFDICKIRRNKMVLN